MKNQRAFTLIELVLVIAIIGLAATLAVFRFGSFAYWQEQGFIRRFTETITFLHHQAVSDQAFYVLDLNLPDNSYRVGVIRPENEIADDLVDMAVDAGNLSLELAAILSPSVGDAQSIIPPPNFPSLWEEVKLPNGVGFLHVNTMRGDIERDEHAYIFFSPRRFSEFAVIHMQLQTEEIITILINPFTGTTTIYPGKKEFEWTYGRKSEKK